MQTNPESAAVDAVAWRRRYVCPVEGPSIWLPAHEREIQTLLDSKCYEVEPLYPQSALDALRGEVERLRAALKAFHSAEAMSNYGDASDFIFPKREMRRPGETAWGWICEKHGLGYFSGCVCCSDEYKAHQERKDREARHARNDALSAARELARDALAKESP